MKKVLIQSVFVVVGMAMFLFALTTYLTKNKIEATLNNSVEAYMATVTGEYICLINITNSANTNGECKQGIKAITGEFYAIDVNSFFRVEAGWRIGKKITLSGVVTPIELLSSDMWRQYNVRGIFTIAEIVQSETSGLSTTSTSSVPTKPALPPTASVPNNQTTTTKPMSTNTPINPSTPTEPMACQEDAKICPDGSSVSRGGPRCEFAACPTANATSAQVSTFLGGSGSVFSVTLSPQQIVSDSRCPADVTCVWPGTVELKTSVASMGEQGQYIFTLGTSQKFGDYFVTLRTVTPPKTTESIPQSSYRFIFEVTK